MKKKIIFHSAIDIFKPPLSGDSVRPKKMYQAFLDLGYEIYLIHGNGDQRRASFKKLFDVENISSFDFFYSELSSRSIYVADASGIPRFFLDFSYIKKIKKNGVPIGFFYRDIHWRYRNPGLLSKKSLVRPISYLFHCLELINIWHLSNILFIPSMGMKKYIPLKGKIILELPPGGDFSINGFCLDVHKPLKLFYVGGVGTALYDLSDMISVVNRCPNITLTICARKEDWDRANYIVGSNVRIIHLHGKEMMDELSKHHALLMYYKPHPYRNFAVPVKMFESVCAGLPVITDSHGYASKIIERDSLGFSVNSPQDLFLLLNDLDSHPCKLSDFKRGLQSKALKHTWKQRAITVASEFYLIGD